MIPVRLLKKAGVLTHPTPARRDAPYPRRGRRERRPRGGTYQASLEPRPSIKWARIVPLPPEGLDSSYQASLEPRPSIKWARIVPLPPVGLTRYVERFA